jgi:glycosyltransferase involved in cell wall biosynthesis
MTLNNDKKEIIFILPYLNVNTTSAERFKSFISAFQANSNCSLTVIIINYPTKKSLFSGYEKQNDFFFSAKTIYHNPRLNIFQKLGFYCLNKDYLKLWKILKLIQLIVFRTDIFYPNKLNNFINDFAGSKGFVIVSGGPFSFFNPAFLLSKSLKFKLIVDYRDPQTFGYVPLDGFLLVYWLRILLERLNEVKILKNAELIVTVSRSLKNLFPNKYLHKINIVSNGSNFNANDVIMKTPNEVFNVLYAGTIYNDQLLDKSFFNALNKFLKNKDLSKISLKFIGSSQNENLYKIIKDFHLENITEITPRLKKDELLNYLNNASLFFHLKLGNRKNVISSKQAEYLMFRRPILLPISDYGDMAESIINHNAGYVCESESQIFETLELLWNKFKNGENLFIQQNEEFIESISREKIAENFVKLLLED